MPTQDAKLLPHVAKARFWSVRRGAERCYWHVDGVKERFWPIPKGGLSRDVLRDRWGSGMYRVTWLGENRKTVGSSPECTIDDPQHPPKPTYPNAPTAEDIAAAAAPEKPTGNGAGDGLAQIAALLGGGGAGMREVAMMQFLFGTQREIRREEMAFAEQRLTREMRVHEQTLARDREYYRTQLDNQKQLYDALLRVGRGRDDEDDGDEDDIREELDEIKLRLEKGAAGDESGTEFLARQGGELLALLKANPQYIGKALEWLKSKAE